MSKAQDDGPVDGSLFDAPGPSTLPGFDTPAEAVDSPKYGTPGPQLSRTAPYFRGLLTGFGLLSALAICLAIVELEEVLLIVLVAAFLAVGLNPVVELLIRRARVKRGVAVLIVALGVLIVLGVILFVLISVLTEQVQHFVDRAPHLLDSLREHAWIRHLDDKYHFISDLQSKLDDSDIGSTVLRRIFSTGLGALQVLVSMVVVFILMLYFLSALPRLKRNVYRLAPASRRERVSTLGDEILHRVGGYVIGAFLVALLAGTVTLTFLLIIGLGQYALPLALLVSLLDLVPLVGSITGAAIVSIVCLANSLQLGIAAAIFYLIYETLEGYVIYPRVMRSSVDIPEYVTIIAVLAGGALAGIVGALIALPIAAGLLLLVREVWVTSQQAK